MGEPVCGTCNDTGELRRVVQDPVRGGTFTRDKVTSCPDCDGRYLARDEAEARRGEERRKAGG